MTLHRINSRSGRAAAMPAPAYIQGGYFRNVVANPDEQMELVQDADNPTVLILMRRGNQRALLELDLSAASLVVDNTVVGIGGRDDNVNSPLAVTTCYEIRVVCDGRGELAGLILTTSGNAPVIPAGYPWQSPVLCAGVTDGAADFIGIDDEGQGWFSLQAAQNVLNNGLSAASIPIDCSAVVPESFTALRVSMRPEDTAAHSTYCQVTRSVSGLPYAALFDDIGAGSSREKAEVVANVTRYAGSTAATALYYRYGLAPTGGLKVDVIGFLINRR